MAISPACSHSLVSSLDNNNNLASSQLEPEFGADPITEVMMNDPVIDQCPEGGHTFDRSTLMLMKERLSEGEPLLCPFSRHVIDTNHLVTNLFAKEANERYLKEKKEMIQFEQRFAKCSLYLDLKNDNTAIKLLNKQLNEKCSKLENENAELRQTIVELNNENSNVNAKKVAIEEKLKNLEAAFDKRENPGETLYEMSWTERGYAVLYPSYYATKFPGKDHQN